MRTLPSLNAVRAFEAAARHLSFTRAAEELHVTQGAVSHQIRSLEDQLGVKLFRRGTPSLTLTEAGQLCLPYVRDAFASLAAGFDALRAEGTEGVLTVSVSPNFATKWLVHRLAGFTSAHPEIDLRISASMQHVDLSRDDVDLAVRHGNGHWPGLHVERLARETLFPVCSPRLLQGPHGLRQPANLKHHDLLHLDDRNDWRKWLDAAGVKNVDLSRGAVFNQASLAIDAAVDGQGVALARTCLASTNLISGRLVKPFSLELEVRYAYYIVTTEHAAKRPKVASFIAWLQSEARHDEARRTARV